MPAAQGIVELCCARYRDSDSPYVGMREAALCTLRCQLLMALHDQVRCTVCVAGERECAPLLGEGLKPGTLGAAAPGFTGGCGV